MAANSQGASTGQPAKGRGYPYESNKAGALVLLVVALVVILVTGISYVWTGKTPGYTGGGAAATVGILLILALMLAAPTLILDDAPEAGGEPSTMRILSLAVVFTFCVITLRTGWNDGRLPSLENEGNWVWLVTAALGGKAVQKYSEVQQKKKEMEETAATRSDSKSG